MIHRSTSLIPMDSTPRPIGEQSSTSRGVKSPNPHNPHNQTDDLIKVNKIMREKVLEYLKKPTAKKKAELTTMEQKWTDAQLRGSKESGEKKPATK